MTSHLYKTYIDEEKKKEERKERRKKNGWVRALISLSLFQPSPLFHAPCVSPPDSSPTTKAAPALMMDSDTQRGMMAASTFPPCFPLIGIVSLSCSSSSAIGLMIAPMSSLSCSLPPHYSLSQWGWGNAAGPKSIPLLRGFAWVLTTSSTSCGVSRDPLT